MRKSQGGLAGILSAVLFLTGCAYESKDLLVDIIAPADTIKNMPQDFSAVSRMGFEMLEKNQNNGAENIVISPVSAYVSLAASGAGAKGETAAAFENVLGLGQNEYLGMCQLIEEELLEAREGSEITWINSIWFDEMVEAKEDYLKKIKGTFSADVRQMDMRSKNIEKKINAWVSKRTEKRITNAVHDISSDVGVLLLNAVSLDAQWRYPFERHRTREADFTLKDGSTVRVDFMSSNDMDSSIQFQYFEDDDVEGVILPYADERLGFLCAKPKGGHMEDVPLNADGLQRWLDSTQTDRPVIVRIPKFEAEHTLDMKNVLEPMGLGKAFDPQEADFSAMGKAEVGNLFIGRAEQRASIRIDEKGTKAGAKAEQEALASSSPGGEFLMMDFNSPFFYAVVDLETGVPLFLGQLDNPKM